MNKKIKILISGALVSVLIISSPFTFKNSKAIAGVDDAIMLAVLGTLAIGSIGACYGLEKSGVLEKTANVIGDGLQDIGSGFKTVYDGVQFAKSTATILPSFLNAYSNVEGTEFNEYIIPSGSLYNIPVSYVEKDSIKKIVSFSFPISNNKISLNVFSFDGVFTGRKLEFVPKISNISVFLQNKYEYTDLYVGDTENYSDALNKGILLTSPSLEKGFNGYLEIPTELVNSAYTTSIAPSLNDVQNKPTSISLDKAKAEAIANDYVEKYPDDNDGDKKVNYADLIPFVFDLLEKNIGDGAITPTNLSNSGLVSYVYEDGQIVGQYPYKFDEGNSNINVNVNVNNNLDNNVSEEEKNGVLNLIDGGFRATSERFKSLNESFSGFKNTVVGIFDFFPSDVQNIFFLAIILMAVFFVLGLRR